MSSIDITKLKRTLDQIERRIAQLQKQAENFRGVISVFEGQQKESRESADYYP